MLKKKERPPPESLSKLLPNNLVASGSPSRAGGAMALPDFVKSVNPTSPERQIMPTPTSPPDLQTFPRQWSVCKSSSDEKSNFSLVEYVDISRSLPNYWPAATLAPFPPPRRRWARRRRWRRAGSSSGKTLFKSELLWPKNEHNFPPFFQFSWDFKHAMDVNFFFIRNYFNVEGILEVAWFDSWLSGRDPNLGTTRLSDSVCCTAQDCKQGCRSRGEAGPPNLEESVIPISTRERGSDYVSTTLLKAMQILSFD